MPEHDKNLERLCNLYEIGRIKSHELPSIAESLMAEGKETPSLVLLSILDSPYSEDKRRLFELAMSELGRRIPSQKEAAMALAREIAREIIKGNIEEYEGGTKIWKEILDYVNPIPEPLWVFKANASAIEDYMIDTEQFGSDHAALIMRCKKEIREAANKIVEERKSRNDCQRT